MWWHFRLYFGLDLSFFGHEVGLDHDILDLDKGKRWGDLEDQNVNEELKALNVFF